MAERASDPGEIGEIGLRRRAAVVPAAGRPPPVQQLDGWSRLVAARLQAHPGSQGRLGRVQPELRVKRLVPKRQAARGCSDVERLEEDADARREEPALGVLDGSSRSTGTSRSASWSSGGARARVACCAGTAQARILHELGPDRSHESALCALS